ncbi:hypothetical protein V6N13_097927 [Hibiscus sabdariffa]
MPLYACNKFRRWRYITLDAKRNTVEDYRARASRGEPIGELLFEEAANGFDSRKESSANPEMAGRDDDVYETRNKEMAELRLRLRLRLRQSASNRGKELRRYS